MIERGSGAVAVRLPAGARIPAPRAGVRLGVRGSGHPGADTAAVLRLFRQGGTSIAAVAAEDAVRLLVLRACGAGLPVRVLTPRATAWQPVLRGPDAQALPPGAELGPAGGPSLVVDDRPNEARRLGDGAAAWRCRVDVRAAGSAADLRALAQADLLLLGPVEPDLALAATASLGVALPSLAQLTGLPRGTVAVLRRRSIEFVTLDPTDAEGAALRA